LVRYSHRYGQRLGVNRDMKPKVYMLKCVPLEAGANEAHVTLSLAGFPDTDEDTLFFDERLSVTWRQTGRSRDLVISGRKCVIENAVDRWPAPLAPWRSSVKAALNRAERRGPDKPFKVGKWSLPWHERTLVMGILNVTPDSFSDGGQYDSTDAAIEHARRLVEDGADIIDVGGESTRPAGVYGEGAAYVSAEEEKRRVLPVISRLAEEIDAPISIDTYKAEVAEAAIRSGAHIVNDVWGLKRDPKMAEVVARYNVPVVVMHNREQTDYAGPVVQEVLDDLLESVDIAHAAGVEDHHIILDPGIGFAKTYEHNLHVMHHLEQIAYLGYPVLLGTSRKSIVGQTLGLPVDQRVEGTGATLAYGIVKGCHIVRVHDVKEMVRVCRMTDVLVRFPKGVSRDASPV
jgi:dihydropteroate synthase